MPTTKVRVDCEKSNAFRVIHADGVYGGTTPRLQLFIAFYNERFPIPKAMTYEVSEAGAPEREIIAERESKEGIFREVEVGVVFDINVAKAFAVWLTEKVAELEKKREQILGGSKAMEEIHE